MVVLRTYYALLVPRTGFIDVVDATSTDAAPAIREHGESLTTLCFLALVCAIAHADFTSPEKVRGANALRFLAVIFG